ncbi:plasmid partitioning protein RepA [Methylosinus sporium]|uniref:Plasmid partitioning protein RepA n=1 Tax=Methylosinus sporium TaxID=428 RepID=A0A549SMK7_METSR|nr:plasmid partitioning protein RepA [Methylosinus sporium]TRL30824.1 plasmid partitioning protein RepA [Methylosinus sporium]
MNAIAPAQQASTLRALIQRHSRELSEELANHRVASFPPSAAKTFRRLQPSEAARLLGVNEGYLRQIAAKGETASPVAVNGRRTYSVDDLHNIRNALAKRPRADRRYLQHRVDGEHLQVITVMNFKGGSGKTTTAIHLAQYLALNGYRVLALDLDPQASLSSLFGLQPDLDVATNETLYGAIRYDGQRTPLSAIVRSTYIPNLHLVPANLELMEFEHETPRALISHAGQTLFFDRAAEALAQVQAAYDVVVIDCPPQLGYLTLSALTAATSVLVTIHPQMLDVASMNQFLQMTGDLLEVVAQSAPGGESAGYDWMRYLVTRFEPSDGPQNQMVGFLRSLFGDHVLNHPTLKSTAISDAGLTNQTIYEVERAQFTRATYDRALEAVNLVNSEIESLIRRAWGREG